MEFEGRQRQRKIPTLTPLIDIVFLLLVFFMLTAHFIKDQSIDITLPEAESAVNLEEDNTVEILLDKEGRILIGKDYIAPDQLETILKAMLQARHKKQVILRGDTDSRLGLTVEVMDAARKAGAESLDIVTRQP